MAKFDYDSLALDVLDIIEEFGNTITITKPYDPSAWTREYDPVEETFTWTNSTTGVVVTTEPEDDISYVQGVVVNIGEDFKDNSLVKMSDSKLLILGIEEPSIGDTYTCNNKVYKYIAHDLVNPAGTVLLYKIAIRV